MIIQRVKTKSTFIVFAFLLAIILSGSAFAIAPAKEPTTYSYVVETGTTYYGPSVIQDAIDDENTADGYNVQLAAGEYYEPVIVNKNITITGTGATAEDTVIIAGGEDGTVTIAPGVSVVLENLSILNMDDGSPVVNNGQLTLTNCYLNGVYVSSEVRGEAVSGANTETTTSTDTSTSSLAATSTSPAAASSSPSAKSTSPAAASTSPAALSTSPAALSVSVVARSTSPAALTPSTGISTVVGQQQIQVKQAALQKTVQKLVSQVLKVQQVLTVFLTVFKVQPQLVQPVIWGFR